MYFHVHVIYINYIIFYIDITNDELLKIIWKHKEKCSNDEDINNMGYE
jgi:hypothetical protein